MNSKFSLLYLFLHTLHSHTRASLAAYARTLRKPSTSQQRELEEKRRRLQIRITNYEKCWSESTFFVGRAIDLEENYLLYKVDESELEGDSGDEWEDDSGGFQPEVAAISLPSKMGLENLMESGLADMAACEVKLWVGQMNDALEQLRIALGEKSLIFKEKVGLIEHPYTGTEV